MSIRNYELTNLIHQAQKTDVETILQSENMDLYQFEVCCDISLPYTLKYLEEHPEAIDRIQKLFEGNDTYYLQQRLKEKFKEETDEQIMLQKYEKLEEAKTNAAKHSNALGPKDYRKYGFDPYMPDRETLIADLQYEGDYTLLQKIKERGLEEEFNKRLEERSVEKIELQEEFAGKTLSGLIEMRKQMESWNKDKELSYRVLDEIFARQTLGKNMDICCELLYPESKSIETCLKERHEAAVKLNDIFHFDEKFEATEQRIKQSSGEECFRICMTPISKIEANIKAQVLRNVFESYYDQASFLSVRAVGANTDLYYTEMRHDSAFAYASGALSMIGKYKDEPELEALFEQKVGDLLSLKTIDGTTPRYFDGREACFSNYSGVGVNAFREKMIETILNEPNSDEARFYLKYKDVLDAGNAYDYRYNLRKTCAVLAESLINEHPDVALALLEGVKQRGDAAFFGKLYDISHNEDLLPMMADRLKAQQNEEGAYNLCDKLLAYQYALISGNEALYEIAQSPLTQNVVIDDETIRLLRYKTDYQPIFEEIKNASLQNAEIRLREAQPDDMPAIGKCLQNLPDLEKISISIENRHNGGQNRSETPEMDASAFLSSPKLKEIIFDECVVTHAEKLLELPNIEVIKKMEDTSFKDADAFWHALEAHKPEHLERIGTITSREAEKDKLRTLMEKYPDLAIRWNGSSLADLEYRNEKIIKAKKSKNINDIKDVISRKGFLEYLAVIDQKDRPSFEDLSKKDENYPHHSCFDWMRYAYGDKYMETLVQVAGLCGFVELAKEAKLIKTAQNKNVAEYINSLPENERPTFGSLCEPTICTRDGQSIIEQIKKFYSEEEYAGVMADILSLTKATKEDMQSLEGDEQFGEIVKQYAKRQQREQTVAASKSAFEKWKQERGGSSV